MLINRTTSYPVLSSSRSLLLRTHRQTTCSEPYLLLPLPWWLFPCCPTQHTLGLVAASKRILYLLIQTSPSQSYAACHLLVTALCKTADVIAHLLKMLSNLAAKELEKPSTSVHLISTTLRYYYLIFIICVFMLIQIHITIMDNRQVKGWLFMHQICCMVFVYVE